MPKNGEERAYLKSQLAYKLGATLDEDPKKRIRAAFWAWAPGRMKYVVFEEEKRRHNHFEAKGLSIGDERFMLKDGSNQTSEFELFKQEHLENDRFDVECEDDFKRAWNKLNYYEREAQEYLERGTATLITKTPQQKGTWISPPTTPTWAPSSQS